MTIGERNKLKEEFEKVLIKWTSYMLKMTKEPNETNYKLKHFEIIINPYVLNDQSTLDSIDQRIVLVLNLKNNDSSSVFFKTFSANLFELFKIMP